MPGARNSQKDQAELREAKRKAREVSAHIENAGIADEEDEDMPPEEGKSLIYGDEVKALGDGKVGGYLVRFSTPDEPDLTGDYFTKDTHFGNITSTNILYHHGQDQSLKARSLGQGTLRTDNVGVWVEAQLKLADDYEKAIYDMVKAGKLRWSSGTASHLVERQPLGKAMWIKSWPLGLDASLTPTPAEPRNAAITIKGTDMSEETITSPPTGAVQPPAAPVPSISEERISNIETGMKAMQEKLDTFMGQFMKMVDSEPVQRLGYVTPDGGTKDKEVKSLGDFAMAVYRNDVKRIESVYGIKLVENTGQSGGYTVPPEFETNIMRMAVENTIVRQRADVRMIAGREIKLPQFDYSVDYSAGNTTALAGMAMEFVGEAEALTDTDVKFRQLHLITNKMGRTIPISNELVRDSRMAIEQTITSMFGDAIAFTEDYYFLRGDGVGAPKGVLASDCLITTGSTLTAAAVKVSEVNAMRKRLAQESRGRAVWVIHPMLLDALFNMNTESNGSSPLVPDATQPGIYRLLGYPILESEKMPEAFSEGGLLLADFSQYYIVDSGGIEIATSEHVYFNSDQIGLRVTKRIDGQARWNAARKVGSGTNSTVSPFVRSK